jgi:hypothetical protein
MSDYGRMAAITAALANRRRAKLKPCLLGCVRCKEQIVPCKHGQAPDRLRYDGHNPPPISIRAYQGVYRLVQTYVWLRIKRAYIRVRMRSNGIGGINVVREAPPITIRERIWVRRPVWTTWHRARQGRKPTKTARKAVSVEWDDSL